MDIREVIEKGGQCIEYEIVDTLKAGQWYEFAETWELPDGRQFLFHCQGFHPDVSESNDGYEFIEQLKPSSDWIIEPSKCSASPYSWEFVHKEYSGPEDSFLSGCAMSEKDCLQQIIEIEENNPFFNEGN